MNARSAVRRFAWGSVLPLVILAVWQVAALRSALVPSVGEVMGVLAHPFREPANLDAIPLGRSALISMIRIAAGFGLAVLTGVPVGVLAGRSRGFHEAVTPALSAAMVISPVAWLPVSPTSPWARRRRGRGRSPKALPLPARRAKFTPILSAASSGRK